MLTQVRTKLAEFRKKPGPIASLADFGLWSLRNALPPWRPKFWIVLAIILAGCIAAVLLPNLRALLIGLTMGFVGLVLLMLTLSYVRTILSVNESITKKNVNYIADRLSRAQADMNALSRTPKIIETGPEVDVEQVERIAARVALESLINSEIMDALVSELDSLRRAVASLAMDDPEADKVLIQLRADLNALSRRVDRRLHIDADALTRLDDALNRSLRANDAGLVDTGEPGQRSYRTG